MLAGTNPVQLRCSAIEALLSLDGSSSHPDVFEALMSTLTDSWLLKSFGIISSGDRV